MKSKVNKSSATKFTAMAVLQLKAECKKAGLTQTGTKAVLIGKLQSRAQ